jgi:signal peptidase I
MRFLKEIFIKIIYLFLLMYLIIFIPKLFGYNPLVVISGSMEPTLKVGGLLYYEEIDINDFKEKDILVYELKDHIISHRVVEHLDNGFITKGDANNSYDSSIVSDNQVLGRGTNWSIPLLGYYADFIFRHKYILKILLSIGIIDLFVDYLIKRKEKQNEKE